MSQKLNNYQDEILSIVKSNISPALMRKKLEDYHENDISEILPDLTHGERMKLYRILDEDMLSNVFEYVEEDDASLYLKEMDLRKAVNILSKMDSDDIVDILKNIEKDKRDNYIELIDDDVKKDVMLVSSFDEDEIGSKMTTNCVKISKNLSIKQAMNELISQASENDNISTVFVLDDDKTFYGAIDLKDLIISRQGDHLEDIIVGSYPYVYGEESITDCIEVLKDYSEDTIPVLDNNNHFLGVITSQNIIELVDDEMSDDYAKFAGLTSEEDLSEPLKESMKKRLPWLLVLLVLGMVVSSVVGIFEKVVTQLTIVMFFQSLILDMAGNVGTQSLAVTIRVLMNESLERKQKVQFMYKEMRIGLCNGLLLGFLSFICIGLYIMLFKDKSFIFAFSVSACIGGSLLLAMLISSGIGTIIPILFKKINIDPAVASGPLITTLNDLVAVITYYSFCWIFLINILKLA